MSCEACREFQATDNGVYWFRWGTADIALLGCRQHIGEVMQVLREHIRRPTGAGATANGNRSTTDIGDEQLQHPPATANGRLGEVDPDPAEGGRRSDSGMPAEQPGGRNDVDV